MPCYISPQYLVKCLSCKDPSSISKAASLQGKLFLFNALLLTMDMDGLLVCMNFSSD